MPGRRQAPPGWAYVYLLDERTTRIDEISARVHAMVAALEKHFRYTHAKAYLITDHAFAVVAPEPRAADYRRVTSAVHEGVEALLARGRKRPAAIAGVINTVAEALSSPERLAAFEVAVATNATCEEIRKFLQTDAVS